MVEIGSQRTLELGSAELARRLSLSRESVHQLLLPLVRAGLLTAVRGRTGGYRAAGSVLSVPIASITAPFESAARKGAPGKEVSRVLDELESRAESARRSVLEQTALGEIVSRVKAEREAFSWEI